MNTKKWVAGLTVLLIALIVSAALFAQDVKPNQAQCPVMGGEINKEVYADHNGERIYFCCNPCVESFKKDPQKYLDKLNKDGVVLEKAPITQKACPVSGKDINPDIYSEYHGKRIYFCCNECKVKFDKDPMKYHKK